MKTKNDKRRHILEKLQLELNELNTWLEKTNCGREYSIPKTGRMEFLEREILNIKRKL